MGRGQGAETFCSLMFVPHLKSLSHLPSSPTCYQITARNYTGLPMDHLPLPKDQGLSGSISIPFMAVDEFCFPFHDYPHRSGWQLRFIHSYDRITTELVPSRTPQSSKDIISFVQEWLYFGMLSEFLGETVNMSLFRKAEEPNPLLVSSSLQRLVCTRTNSILERVQSHGSAIAERWRDSFDHVLLTARHNTLMLVASCCENNNDLALTCLAISALSEYLMKATNALCIRVKVETPVPQKFRISNSDLRVDCGFPITQQMKQRGWCPHDIELLNGARIKNVSTLWYLANLSPPKFNMPHDSCTPAECKSFLIDETQYVPRHVYDGCNCAHVGPDQTQLANIIQSGNIPLIRVSEGEVQVLPQTDVRYFTTISHVWADGKGNPRCNTLPYCVMVKLQRLVNELPYGDGVSNVAFWIDTLCIPRSPPGLRKEAILRMREPYEQALHVLVIDAYLARHVALQASLSELLARIQICGWSQRLWTFQEGTMPRLPSRTWFAFNDKSIDLFVLYKHTSIIPTLASNIVDSELFEGHDQTQFKGSAGLGYPHDYIRSPVALRQSLISRSTLRKEDEALCLGGGILQLPKSYLAEIIDLQDDHARMAKIWAKLPALHAGMAFSKAPEKLNARGFRWAPATFMGNLRLSSKEWEGPNECWDAPSPSLSTKGLIISRPAWKILHADVSYCSKILTEFVKPPELPFLKRLPFGDGNGQWFWLLLEEPWHDSPAPLNADHDWVIILASTHDLTETSDESYREVDKFTTPASYAGLLVSHCKNTEEMEAVQVMAHRHVSIGRVSSHDCDLQNQCKGYADRLNAAHPESMRELRQDPISLAGFIRRHIGNNTSQNEGMLELQRKINIRNGWGGSEALALDDCMKKIRLLIRLGSSSIIRKVENTSWCVD